MVDLQKIFQRALGDPCDKGTVRLVQVLVLLQSLVQYKVDKTPPFQYLCQYIQYDLPVFKSAVRYLSHSSYVPSRY